MLALHLLREFSLIFMGLLEGLLERLVLRLQNLELGGDFVDGGALGKKLCKAESKFKYQNIQAIRASGGTYSMAETYLRWSLDEFRGV
jgi:hypothetical protein